MAQHSPQDLARWTGGAWTALPDRPIAGFSIDSRRIAPGEAFVALRTERRDGREFVGAAAAAGAAAAIVSRPAQGAQLPQLVVPDPLAAFQAIGREHRRTFPGKVIGISGSAGKTSTKELLALLLGPPGEVLATEGNLNNHLGVPLTLTRIERAAHRFAVIEAGISAPGEMAVLAGLIEPDAAIITLVGPAHLAELGGMAGVAREKALLLRAVRAGGPALYPRSCEAHEAFRTLGSAAEAVDFSLRPEGEATAIVLRGAAGAFVLPSASAGMAANAALALELALRLGIAPDLLRYRLSRWRPPPGRGEIRREHGRLLYLDYYNANPASMADALAAFRRVSPEDAPRLLVLGGMEELGAAEERFHRELGASLALRAGDRAIFVGPQGGAVLDGARAAGARDGQVVLAASAADAAPAVAAFAGSIFIKGSRRHRLEEAIGSPVHASAPC